MEKKFVIIFLSLFLTFSFVNMVKPSKTFSENENRVLAEKPELTKETLLDGSFSKDTETFISDQFMLRDFFVKLKTNAEKLSGKKENNGVYFCKDNFLIEKEPSFNETILNTNIKAINKLAEKGYNVNFALIPTAYEIYKDELPKYAYKDIQKNVLKYTNDNLKNVNFIDTYNSLIENSNKNLYYKTDHHQTADGSFVTYKDIVKGMGEKPFSEKDFVREIMSKDFYGTTWSKAPLNIKGDKIIKYTLKNDFEREVIYKDNSKIENTMYNEENLKIKDKYTYYLDGNHSEVIINTKILNNDKQKNRRKLLAIKDSYAHSILPFIANHYEEIHVLDLRYYNLSVKDYLDKNHIKDVLFIYNVTNFMTDNNLVKISAYLK